jgi:serine/threonine-protein kinase
LSLSRGDIPEKIDRYEILEPIGFGAMGAVYKAFDPIIKRPVAVKTIRLDIPPGSPDHRAFLERFTQEARTAGRLSHPNVVTLYDVGHTEENLPWLAMEYVDGHTVAELLQGERLKPEVVIGLVSQIASAIDYAHAEGVVHRDIKPSNVIVYSGEKVKVTDFGIAKLMDADATHSGLMMGTPSYMSPEQAMGEDLDGRTDIFSLGVVAFEMLSGRQPFPGNNVTSILYKLVHSDPVQPDDLEVLGLLPDKWHQVFSRVLAKNPKDRYPSAAAFVQDLELCLGSWFGALEGETVVLRDPLRLGGAGSEETLAVAPTPAIPPPAAREEETRIVTQAYEPPTAELLRPASGLSEAGTQPAEEAGFEETIADLVPDVERTLYAGPGVDARIGVGATDETVVAPSAGAPAMTVTIRKPPSPRTLLLALGISFVVGAAALALLLRQGSGEPPVEAPPEAPEPVAVATGNIHVTTKPPGARVFVDGVERGVAPLDVDLALGLYRVRVESEGFLPAELGAELTEQSPRATLDVSLEPQPRAAPPPQKPAYLRIRSTPPGAQVSIDGRDLGKTPLDRVEVEPGQRAVRIVQEGYVPWEDSVRARAGRTESIEALLTARGAPASEGAPAEEQPAAPVPPPVQEGALVERGEPGVVNPKCLRCPSVPYPDVARRTRLQGVVELRFLIDENGDVHDPEVLSSGGEVFDRAVMESVRAWKYQPATKHGVRVKMHWIQRFRFQQGR